MIDDTDKRGGRQRTAVILAVVVVIAAVIFWQWQLMDDEDLPGWGRGDMKVSERAYYRKRIEDMWRSWYNEARQTERDRQGRFGQEYETILVMDTVKGAVWLERRGQVDRNNYTELPQNMQWQGWRLTPEGKTQIPAIVRVKIRGIYTDRELQEKIFFRGDGRGDDEFRVWIHSGHVSSDCVHGAASLPRDNWKEQTEKEYYDSIVVSNEEYEKTGKDERVAQEPVSNWRRMDKLVYGAIERQVSAAGYDLGRFKVHAGQEGNSARADVGCREGGLLSRFFGSNSKETCLKINYLGDDVWYVMGGPTFGISVGNKNSHLDMEFLIYPRGAVRKSQVKGLIVKGRKEHPFNASPTSEFKAVLGNGVTIELLGVCNAPSVGRRWWGVDGEYLDYEPFFYDEPRRSGTNENRYEIAWKFGWPAGTTESHMNGLFNSSRFMNSRGGTHQAEDIIVKGFECKESGSPASLMFKIKIGNQSTPDEVTFANISLTPGQDHGVKIEMGAEAK